MRSTTVALASLLLAPTAFAQATQLKGSKLEFANWWIAPREDLFPGFLSAAGSAAGDGLFKVLPGEVLERAGNHRLSGYVMGISVDNAFTGSFPRSAFLPGLQLYRTRLQTFGASTYEVPDTTRPVGPLYERVFVALQADSEWVVEVRFDTNSPNAAFRQALDIPGLVNGQRAGLAMMALATPGARRDPTRANLVMLASHGERHLPPGRDSYSGSYVAATGTIAMYGQAGQPSATGELLLAPRFITPTLQVYGSSAGGVLNDPLRFETHLGPGAYATDLASRAQQGFFGLFVHAEHLHAVPATHRVFPFLVATSAGGPNLGVPVGAVTLRVNPLELGAFDLFVGAGIHGPLTTYAARGSAGFDEDQLGAYASPRIPFGPDPALIGMSLWIQGVVTTNAMVPVDTTNVVRFTLN